MTSEEAPSIIIATLYEIDQLACGLEPTAAIQVGNDVSPESTMFSIFPNLQHTGPSAGPRRRLRHVHRMWGKVSLDVGSSNLGTNGVIDRAKILTRHIQLHLAVTRRSVVGRLWPSYEGTTLVLDLPAR